MLKTGRNYTNMWLITRLCFGWVRHSKCRQVPSKTLEQFTLHRLSTKSLLFLLHLGKKQFLVHFTTLDLLPSTLGLQSSTLDFSCRPSTKTKTPLWNQLQVGITISVEIGFNPGTQVLGCLHVAGQNSKQQYTPHLHLGSILLYVLTSLTEFNLSCKTCHVKLSHDKLIN